MKTPFTLLLLLPLFMWAQDLPSIPFQQALVQAQMEKKLLMVQLFSTQCIQCNEVAIKGFASDMVKSRLEKNEFILTAYASGSKDHAAVTAKYKLPNDLTVLLFLSPEGSLLHKYTGSSTFGPTYISHMDKALVNARDEKGMAEFEKAYRSGSRNPALLLQLLNYREQFGLDQQDLLDEYARALPADSLNSLTQLQTLARFAPVLQTYADSALRRNRDPFNEAWYRLSLQERSAINARIIGKTKAKAIANKDRSLIQRTANFASGVSNDPFRASRSYYVTKMDYALATGDTAGYIKDARLLMDYTYMPIRPDSIRMADSMARQKTFESLRPQAGGNSTVSFAYTPTTQMYANDMNQVAFRFYKITDSIPLLKKALSWSERSLAFYESAASFDTYARLLYKTGDREKAIVYQRKAIEDARKKNLPGREYEVVLERMIKGETKLE